MLERQSDNLHQEAKQFLQDAQAIRANHVSGVTEGEEEREEEEERETQSGEGEEGKSEQNNSEQDSKEREQ